MSSSKDALYTARQIRRVEQQAIDHLGLSQFTLMQRAAEALLRTVQKRFPKARCLAIYCGGGNNGGDGYLLAYLAHQAGLSVHIYHDNIIADLPEPAQFAANQALSSSISAHALDDALDSDVDLIVDALLGIGINGDVRPSMKSVIEYINDQEMAVLSVDIPSGLHASTGKILGCSIKASLTITFIGLKAGLYTCDGPDMSGEIVVEHIGLSELLNTISPIAYLLKMQQFSHLTSIRKKNVHKGSFGHVLVVGGGRGMPGAAVLSAMASMRVGAGSVTLAMHPRYANQPLASFPEAMVYGIDSVEDLPLLLDRANVCILGPGLGNDSWSSAVFSKVLSSQIPLIVDASALKMLSFAKQRDDHWILTPHPGEAAQLLQQTTTDIQSDRWQAALDIQRLYGGTVVLKGVGSIVDSGQGHAYLCPAGNPGMATAGMGDVLSGIIGGLVAQGFGLQDAARLGVWIHAKSGDDAAANLGQKGLLASDLMPYIRKRINSLS